MATSKRVVLRPSSVVPEERELRQAGTGCPARKITIVVKAAAFIIETLSRRLTHISELIGLREEADWTLLLHAVLIFTGWTDPN